MPGPRLFDSKLQLDRRVRSSRLLNSHCIITYIDGHCPLAFRVGFLCKQNKANMETNVSTVQFAHKTAK